MNPTTTAAPPTIPELGAWKDEILAFLETHAERRAQQPGGFRWGVGSDRVALFSEPDRAEEAPVIAAAKATSPAKRWRPSTPASPSPATPACGPRPTAAPAGHPAPKAPSPNWPTPRTWPRSPTS